MKKLLFTFLIALFTLTISYSQGISGNWKTTLESPQGSLELTFIYKVDGAKLTGTVSSPMGSQEINNGIVSENNFSYAIDMMGNEMKFNGKLENDLIKLTMAMPEGSPQGAEGPGELKLTRVN